MPIQLGRRLRPIVLGVGGDRSLGPRDMNTRMPDLVLGVYAYDQRLIGYLAIEAMRSEGCWGGLTMGDFGLGDALVLARRSAAALALGGLRRGAHHCVCLAPADLPPKEQKKRQPEFIDALGPLFRLGLLRVVFDESVGRIEPSLAHRASAEAAAVAAAVELSRQGIPEQEATVSLHDATPLALHTYQLLLQRGLRPFGSTGAGLATASDVLVVGTPLWSEQSERESPLRARVVAPLGAANLAPDTRRRLADRGVVVLPDSIPVAGMFLALDFRSRGLTEAAALEQSRATLLERIAASPGEPRS